MDLSEQQAAVVNRELAAVARELAEAAPSASFDRKVYGCAAAALSATGTIEAARRALDDVDQADVHAAAIDVIGALAEGWAAAADADRSRTPGWSL